MTGADDPPGPSYLVWKVRGHLLITITNADPNPESNAVLSGMFFDAAG